jgi:hypothetical protein
VADSTTDVAARGGASKPMLPIHARPVLDSPIQPDLNVSTGNHADGSAADADQTKWLQPPAK